MDRNGALIENERCRGNRPVSRDLFRGKKERSGELPTPAWRYDVGFPIHWGLPQSSWIFYVLAGLVLHPLQGQKR